MCLAQGHNAVTPVRLAPAAPRSRVKHSTTEPLRSLVLINSTGHDEMSNDVVLMTHVVLIHLYANSKIEINAFNICAFCYSNAKGKYVILLPYKRIKYAHKIIDV